MDKVEVITLTKRVIAFLRELHALNTDQPLEVLVVFNQMNGDYAKIEATLYQVHDLHHYRWAVRLLVYGAPFHFNASFGDDSIIHAIDVVEGEFLCWIGGIHG